MNPKLLAIAPSMIRAIHARKGPHSFDFGLGEPTLAPSGAPFEAATRWVQAHGCPYSPNAGFAELREAIASHYALPTLGEGANVCVTHGSQEALYLAIKTLLDPATDEVLIVEPSYPLYPKLCQLEGIAVEVAALSPDSGFAPRAEAVLAALRSATRLIVLGSPSNPTGRVWSAAELQRLARGLLERAGAPVWVLSDEVYRELWYGPEAPESIARYYPHVLVANSLSKSHALTGLRLGWLMGPRSVISEVIKAHQFLTTAASTYSQRVAIEVFADPASFAAHRAHYGAVRPVWLAALERFGLRGVEPEGGFYQWLRLPEAWAEDSVAAAYALIEQADVITVPGRAFGRAAEGWLRLSWVGETPRLLEGLGRLAEALRPS